jgi:hypothetical protein
MFVVDLRLLTSPLVSPNEKFEDTRGEVRIRKSTTDRQDNSQKKSLKIQEEK